MWEAFTAVTAAPDWVAVALQALVTAWLPPKDQVTFQLRVVVVPEPLTVTVAVKPEPQSLSTWYEAVQAAVPPPPPPPPPEPPPIGSKEVDLIELR